MPGLWITRLTVPNASFIEENHVFKEKKRQMEINRENNNRKGHHRAPQSMMQYWGKVHH